MPKKKQSKARKPRAKRGKKPQKPKAPAKKIMLVQKGCPYCADAKEKIKDKIKSKKVQVVSATSKRGSKLVKEHNIRDVPTFIVKGKKKEPALICNLDKSGKSLSCAGNQTVKL